MTTLKKYQLTVRTLEQGVSPQECQFDTCVGSDTGVNKLPPKTLLFPVRKRNPELFWYAELCQKVEKGIAHGLLDNAIVHGSYGDDTFTPFSDLEITLLLPAGLIENSEKCVALKSWLSRDLNPLIMKIDPLQHHGPFYLWPSMLASYNERILPLVSYENAWAFKSLELTFSPVEFQIAAGDHSFHKVLYALHNYNRAFFHHGLNPYSIKRMLSHLMLLPALFFQFNGEIVSKAEAINRLLRFEISEINKALCLATEFRSDWPVSPVWLGKIRGLFMGARIPSRRADRIFTSCYRNEKLQNRFQDEMLPLVPAFCRAVERMNEDFETL